MGIYSKRITPSSVSNKIILDFWDNASGSQMTGMTVPGSFVWRYRFETQSTWTTVTVLAGTLGTFAGGTIVANSTYGGWQICPPDAAIPTSSDYSVIHEIFNATLSGKTMEPIVMILQGLPLSIGGTINTLTGTANLTSLVVSAGTATLNGGLTSNITGNVTGNLIGGISGTGSFYCVGLTGTANFSSLVVQAGTITLNGGLASNITGNITGFLNGSVSGNVGGNLLGGIAGTGSFYCVGLTGTANFSSLVVQAGSVTLNGGLISSILGTLIGSITGSVGSVVGDVNGNIVGGIKGTVSNSAGVNTLLTGVNTTQWGGFNVTGMPMPTYAQPAGFLTATFPSAVSSVTNAELLAAGTQGTNLLTVLGSNVTFTGSSLTLGGPVVTTNGGGGGGLNAQAVRDALALTLTPGTNVGTNSIDSLLSALAAAGVAFHGPLDPATSQLRLVRGDDYTLATGRALSFSITGYPDFTGGTLTLSIRQSGVSAPLVTAVGTLVSGGSTNVVRVELTRTQTAALPVDPQAVLRWDLQVTLAGGDIITPLVGGVRVIADVTT